MELITARRKKAFYKDIFSCLYSSSFNKQLAALRKSVPTINCIDCIRERWIIISLFMLIVQVPVSFASMPEIKLLQEKDLQPDRVIIVERDTLQTRNLRFIINHAALVASTSSSLQRLVIDSPIPQHLDQVGRFWPKFGLETAVSSMPLPNGIAGYTQNHLGSPTKVMNDKIAYRWATELSPEHAAVAQYDNYYGLPYRFAVGPGKLEMLGLSILSNFEAQRVRGDLVFRMEVTLRNVSDRPLSGLYFRLAFPEVIVDLEKRRRLRLLTETRHSVSSTASYSRVGHADGFGNRVIDGHTATITRDDLLPDESVKLSLEIEGIPPAPNLEIHPVFVVAFQQYKGARAWPKTEVMLNENLVTVVREYYSNCNAVISAPLLFVVRDHEVQVADPRDIDPIYVPNPFKLTQSKEQ